MHFRCQILIPPVAVCAWQVYRVKDEITYSLKLEEYDAAKGGWSPFEASDVQMEFVMLDPFERITLNNTAGQY